MTTDTTLRFEDILIHEFDVTCKGRTFGTTVEYGFIGAQGYAVIHQDGDTEGITDVVILSKEKFLEIANTIRGH